MPPFDPFADRPGLRPGERMVAGKPSIFDLDALADWLAIDAKRTAPDDLSALQGDALDALFWRAVRLAALSGHRDLELFERVALE
ncbi:MAG: hypothetical protein ACREEW_19165, partial [Caulobacteraceae bacterium]